METSYLTSTQALILINVIEEIIQELKHEVPKVELHWTSTNLEILKSAIQAS